MLRLLSVLLLASLPILADSKPLPKPLKPEEAAKAKGEWFDKTVMPRQYPDKIQIRDIINGQEENWTPHHLLNCRVLEDREGFLRLHDGRREGWVEKADMVLASDAPAWWDKIVKQSPADSQAWLMRGICWKVVGQPDKAIRDYTESIRLKPEEANAFHNRAIARIAKNEVDKALRDYDEAIRLEPKNSAFYRNRGDAWIIKKDLDKAMKDYNEAIQLDPNSARNYLNRAVTWLEQKDDEKAIKDLDEVIRLDPKNAVAYYYRAIIWKENRQYDKAIREHNEMIRLTPEAAHAYSARGDCYFLLKDYEKAFADVTKAHELDPQYDAALNRLAWFYSTCPDAKYRNGAKAVEYGKKLSKVASAWSGHQETIAAAYAETGDFDRAVAIQKKAIELLKAEKLNDKDLLKAAESRLELFQAKKPYRDEQ